MQRKPLYIMLLLFIMPIALAKLVLVNGWYQGGETNSGQLISPPISIANPNKAWLMLYNPSKQCGNQCLQSLWQIQQTHTLLASEGNRVQTYLTAPIQTSNQTLQSQQQDIHLPQILTAVSDMPALQPNTLYLIDPLGNAFMRYQFPIEHQSAVNVSAGLLKDIKRLLKISKIG